MGRLSTSIMNSVFSLLFICCFSLSSPTLANSSSYGKIGSLHEDSTQEYNKALASKEEIVKKIEEVISFMKQFNFYAKRHESEAIKFKIYVNAHIESIASCRNLEAQFEDERLTTNMSAFKTKLYKEEIEECFEDLDASTVSYSRAKSFFEGALTKLGQLKEQNEMASIRYSRNKKNLEEIIAAVDYWDSTRY